MYVYIFLASWYKMMNLIKKRRRLVDKATELDGLLVKTTLNILKKNISFS